MKFTTKLAEAPAGSFHVLDPAKAKRMGAATMYIPSPDDIRAIVDALPKGSTVELAQVRKQLAANHNADTACPWATRTYWTWMAWAMETESGPALPWWRVTKDGGAYAKLPGGIEAHRTRLAGEGVVIR